MNFSQNIFSDYFRKKIDDETLKKEIGFYDKGFSEDLHKELETTFELKDSKRLDYSLFPLYFIEDVETTESEEHNLSYFRDILDELIICDWHKSHEDIVRLLQQIGDEKSIDYLYKAIPLDLEYLAWDTENYTFKVKCVKAIRKIAREKGSLHAMETLELLCDNENQRVREVAKQAIEKVKNSEKDIKNIVI